MILKYGIAVEKNWGSYTRWIRNDTPSRLNLGSLRCFRNDAQMPCGKPTDVFIGEWLHSTVTNLPAGIKLEVYLSGNHNQKWVPIKTKKNHFSFSATTSTLAPSIFRGSLSGNWAAGIIFLRLEMGPFL